MSQESISRLSLWDRLTEPDASILGVERKQAKLAIVLALMFLLFTVFYGLTIFQRPPIYILQVFGIPLIINLLAYFITRTKYYYIGSFLLSFCFCATGYLYIITSQTNFDTGILFLIPIALTLSSAIISTWLLFSLIWLNIVTIYLLQIAGIRLSDNIAVVEGLVISFGFVLLYINYFRNNINTEQFSNLQKVNQESVDIRNNMQQLVNDRTLALDRRATRLESAAYIARTAAEIRDINELLDKVSKQISDRFGYYHIGIFLADADSLQLNLVAASSDSGQRMLANGHKLSIGREGIVGFAASQKRPRIAQSVGSDDVFLNNPELPATRSEAALPLLAQTRLVGVLDIQSEEENAFTPEDVSILQTMTDQIAMAIENIRLYEESRSALRILELANIDNMTRAWQEKLGNQVLGYTYTPLGIEPISAFDQVSKPDSKSQHTIKIPIMIRSKEIGSISLLRKSKDSQWTEAEREMAQGLATQVGLAIDNARLLEESQIRAVREQTINDFSSHFSRSLDIDTLLKNAVREIYQIPQVSKVSLFINPVEENLKPE